jgi:alpha-amylase
MKQIYLGLAIHNHQPVGNFPWVFQQAYRQAYLPLLQALEQHPSVRLSLHYSGPLLDWLRENHPEFLSRVLRLVNRGQVEIMSGAYYEPILPAIPDADKLGQIEKMSQVLARELGCSPTGLWLAERVWEPHLPRILAGAGISWTVVDDTHFKLVGLEDKDLFGYYLTEEQGCLLKVFATSKYLRYSIPWRSVEEVISFLREEVSETEMKIAVMGDDGEKFGVWPGTYRYCWEQGWVEQLFSALEQNQHWLHTIPLGEWAQGFPPRGRIYLPCASYDEMLEWALPVDRQLKYLHWKQQLEAEGKQEASQFMRGGFWRHFLVKYPEINWMHKKMLHVHRKVYQARALSPSDCGREELWKGQCNCPYWHGVFGGIYLADARVTTYHHLIKAEEEAERALHPDPSWLKEERVDFDGDGEEELLVEGKVFSLYLRPGRGGALIEWDVHPQCHNLLSTLCRRPEAYHRALLETPQGSSEKEIHSIHDLIQIKDAPAGQHLSYDRYPRHSLLDHFIDADTTLEDFARGAFAERGDFVDQPYECRVEPGGRGLRLALWREGYLHRQGDKLPFEVRKEIWLRAGRREMAVNYQLTNTGASLASGIFASEWNLNLLGGGHNPQAYYRVPGVRLKEAHLDSRGELGDIGQVSLISRHLGIELRLKISPRVRLWRFPVETVSNSEGGLERVYQASCIVLLSPFNLSPGESFSLRLLWGVK